MRGRICTVVALFLLCTAGCFALDQEYCVDHGVKKWYANAVENYDSLSAKADQYTFKLLGMHETRGGFYDRKTQNVRSQIEEKVLSSIEQQQLAKEDPVRLLTMCSKGLLQEWFLVGKLIQKGYSNIELLCINPEVSQKACEGFRALSNALEEEGITLSISHYTSLKECKRAQNEKVHAICAVDVLDSLLTYSGLKDMAQSCEMLSSSGQAFIGYNFALIGGNAEGHFELLSSYGLFEEARKKVAQQRVQALHPRSRPYKILTATDMSDLGLLLTILKDLCKEGYQDVVIELWSGLPGSVDYFVKEILTGFSTKTSQISCKKARRLYTSDQRHMDLRNMLFVWTTDSSPKEMLKRAVPLLKHDRLLKAGGCALFFSPDTGLWNVDRFGGTHLCDLMGTERDKAAQELVDLFDGFARA